MHTDNNTTVPVCFGLESLTGRTWIKARKLYCRAWQVVKQDFNSFHKDRENRNSRGCGNRMEDKKEREREIP